MSESNPVTAETEKSLSEMDRLREIDIRVGARLMEKELHRAEYTRGFCDAAYICALIVIAIYVFFTYGKAE